MGLIETHLSIGKQILFFNEEDEGEIVMAENITGSNIDGMDADEKEENVGENVMEDIWKKTNKLNLWNNNGKILRSKSKRKGL